MTVDKVLNWLAEEGGVKGTSVCDAGCGTGSLSIPLALQGAKVYGSDISEAMVGPPLTLKAAFFENLSLGKPAPNPKRLHLCPVQIENSLVGCDLARTFSMVGHKLKLTISPAYKMVLFVNILGHSRWSARSSPADSLQSLHPGVVTMHFDQLRKFRNLQGCSEILQISRTARTSSACLQQIPWHFLPSCFSREAT